MKFIADLEIHSRYARACSQELTIPNIAAWAGRKGLQVVGTGDFTHPAWMKEIKEKLELAEEGLYKLKKEYWIPASPTGEPRALAAGMTIMVKIYLQNKGFWGSVESCRTES